AARAAKFADQYARLKLCKTFAMPFNRRENRCHFVPERDGDRLLQVAAPNHRRISIASRQAGKRSCNYSQILLDNFQTFPNLHYGGSVRDVLRRRAPVAVLSQAILAKRVQLRDNAENGIADALSVNSQFFHVYFSNVTVAHYLDRCLHRNDPHSSLYECKRLLYFKILGRTVFV